jgi:hypothetical protein
MHHQHWDNLIHFPLAAAWMSMPWWIERLHSGGQVLTDLAPYMATAIGILQIAYLVRKHMRLGK